MLSFINNLINRTGGGKTGEEIVNIIENTTREYEVIEELEKYLEWIAYPSGKAQFDDLQRKLDKK